MQLVLSMFFPRLVKKYKPPGVKFTEAAAQSQCNLVEVYPEPLDLRRECRYPTVSLLVVKSRGLD